MPTRITTYKQAFEDVLGIKFNEKLQAFVNRLEKDGHTEKGISFSIWKTQEKLNVYKTDSRFMSILENEIKKWSWTKDDPRWNDYWKKKSEQQRATKIKKDIDDYEADEKTFEDILGARIPKKRKTSGYVYFIQGECGGAIKIGYSVEPQKRLKELQTGYPDLLKILLMIPGSVSIEQIIHRQFEASRLKGEWFRPDNYLIEKIKQLKACYKTEK